MITRQLFELGGLFVRSMWHLPVYAGAAELVCQFVGGQPTRLLTAGEYKIGFEAGLLAGHWAHDSVIRQLSSAVDECSKVAGILAWEHAEHEVFDGVRVTRHYYPYEYDPDALFWAEV